MPSSINSELLILLIFLNVAILGLGKSLLVKSLITLEQSGPETLITASPDTPGPDDKANIVIAFKKFKL